MQKVHEEHRLQEEQSKVVAVGTFHFLKQNQQDPHE